MSSSMEERSLSLENKSCCHKRISHNEYWQAVEYNRWIDTAKSISGYKSNITLTIK